MLSPVAKPVNPLPNGRAMSCGQAVLVMSWPNVMKRRASCVKRQISLSLSCIWIANTSCLNFKKISNGWRSCRLVLPGRMRRRLRERRTHERRNLTGMDDSQGLAGPRIPPTIRIGNRRRVDDGSWLRWLGIGADAGWTTALSVRHGIGRRHDVAVRWHTGGSWHRRDREAGQVLHPTRGLEVPCNSAEIRFF